MAIPIWASTITTWLTPTILFCFLNLAIFSIFISSKLKTHNKQPQLNQVPSLLSRVKSINFSLYKFDHYEALQPQTLLHEDPEPHVARSISDTCEATTESTVPVKMQKSASEAELRRPARVRERKAKVCETVPFEGVDAKADDFINRFKQQLKLQRLDSLLRYQEMLSRGSAK